MWTMAAGVFLGVLPFALVAFGWVIADQMAREGSDSGAVGIVLTTILIGIGLAILIFIKA